MVSDGEEADCGVRKVCESGGVKILVPNDCSSSSSLFLPHHDSSFLIFLFIPYFLTSTSQSSQEVSHLRPKKSANDRLRQRTTSNMDAQDPSSPPLASESHQPERPSNSLDSNITIDHSMYPHIISRLIAFAPNPVLLKLRATCHKLRFEVDTSRLAQHIVIENNEVRTRGAKIFLKDRPELIKYANHILDLVGSKPSEDGREDMADSSYSSAMRKIEHLCPDLVFDVVRLFTTTVGAPQSLATTVKAKTTIYFLDLFDDGAYHVLLPVEPVGGSSTVVVNIRYENKLGLSEGGFIVPKLSGDALYHFHLTPTSRRFRHSPREWPCIPTEDTAERPIILSLITDLAKALYSGPRVPVRFVGYDKWPLIWFDICSSWGQRNARRDRELESVQTSCREAFKSGAGVMARIMAMRSRVNDKTGLSAFAEYADTIAFQTKKEYQDWWAMRSPFGLSVMDPHLGVRR